MDALRNRANLPPPTRRRFIAGAGSAIAGLGIVRMLAVSPANATPETLAAAMREVTKGETPKAGRVTLEIPPLVENGNSVPLTVTVESPLTDADHVKSIHVFNEKNPQPHVATFYLGPRAGRASVTTRIRLADSQTVVAIAKMSDGSLWADRAQVIVTLAACVEEIN
jgi:sulfur-oxidizing protein SoxY